MPEKHALVTGPITGRIPHGKGFVDVTPDVLYLDSEDEVAAITEAIELEHAHRGSHPLQHECSVLSDESIHPGGLGWSEDTVKAHQAAHKALNKKAGI